MRALTVTGLHKPDVLDVRLGCAIFLADGSLGFSNAAFAGLLGYEPESLATRNLAHLTSPDIAEQLRANALDEDAGLGLDCSFTRADGTSIWVHAVASPGDGGSSGSIVLQIISIERQKAIEAALALSESRLTFALEAAGQGVWDHDIATHAMFFSAGWRQMRGISPDEPMDDALESWLGRIHPDDRDHIQAVVGLQTAPDVFRVLEYRERHRDGHYIWIQSRGRPVAWDENGMAIRAIGTDTDITERKERELQFQVISRRLELALEVSRIGVWEQDLDTGDVIWDGRMHEIYGRGQQGEALSEHDWEFAIHPADRQRAKHDFSTAVRNRSDYTSEFRIVLPDGNIRHIRSRGRYFAATAPEADKLIGAEWDITHDVERAEQLYDARLLAEARFNELQKAQMRIRHAAMHDHLTGLPNRRFLDQKLAELSPFTDADGRRMAVLHIDLDWFKQINDQFGHAAGDFMLRHVAGVLRRNARNDDFIARVGGDEFVILSWFSDSDLSLRTIATGIIQALTETVPYDGGELQVGASIGIALADDEPVSAATLLQRADVALYRAKALGRNRYELSAPRAA